MLFHTVLTMIDILYEDVNLVVCVKPVGVNSQNDNAEDMVKILKNQLGSDILPIHRLDTAVGGTMVFAKNSKSAAILSKQISDGSFKKKYLTVITGIPEDKSAVLVDLLFKDSSRNKTFVVNRERKGVKKASLEYDVIASVSGFSLVKVLLHTGRTHQIRVQFASRKMPIVGDGKYGSKDNRCSVALWSYEISFRLNGEFVSFGSLPDFRSYPWQNFDSVNFAEKNVI